ncbi:hypothetical protein [Cobetia crustatorum]|uniref:hypothetical protein n=1 Tax=Cobetia crustatorum TaxID=553385 RepID=UPI0012EBAC82|nr:hypothetical protein [Cobetia crustatorum]
MENLDINDYRERLQNDKGFSTKRRQLVYVSLIILAINLSGAQIKEANTFLFKIEFLNEGALIHLLEASAVYLLFRYYAYAHNYHEYLFKFWSERLMADTSVLIYNGFDDEYHGLLAKKINGQNCHDIGDQVPEYRKVSILRRSICYRSTIVDEYYGEVYVPKCINLNEYDDSWKRKDLIKLFSFEFKYRYQAFFNNREHVDLLFPYIICLVSLLSVFNRLMVQ